MDLDTFTRDPGPRFVVRGWTHDGRMADPIYTDDRAAALEAIRTLGLRVPSGTFTAEDSTDRHLLAKSRRGNLTHH